MIEVVLRVPARAGRRFDHDGAVAAIGSYIRIGRAEAEIVDASVGIEGLLELRLLVLDDELPALWDESVLPP